MDHDGWDLTAQYTWLWQDETKNSIELNNAKGLVSSYQSVFDFGDFSTSFINKASSEFKQHFNVVDLELGRNFFISRYLTLRPNMGLKFSWIKDKFDYNYAIPVTTSPDVITIFDLDTAAKKKMWGMGIRAGIDNLWHFNKHWGIYGDLAFTGLWSYFDTRAKTIETSSVSGTHQDFR